MSTSPLCLPTVVVTKCKNKSKYSLEISKARLTVKGSRSKIESAYENISKYLLSKDRNTLLVTIFCINFLYASLSFFLHFPCSWVLEKCWNWSVSGQDQMSNVVVRLSLRTGAGQGSLLQLRALSAVSAVSAVSAGTHWHALSSFISVKCSQAARVHMAPIWWWPGPGAGQAN